MRRGPRNLRIAFDHRGLTNFGGAYFFHEFLQALQMRRFLSPAVPYPRRNHRYSVAVPTALTPSGAAEDQRRNARRAEAYAKVSQKGVSGEARVRKGSSFRTYRLAADTLFGIHLHAAFLRCTIA